MTEALAALVPSLVTASAFIAIAVAVKRRADAEQRATEAWERAQEEQAESRGQQTSDPESPQQSRGAESPEAENESDSESSRRRGHAEGKPDLP